VSKGFVLFAQNTEKTDYVKQAYALALSIKHSQTSVSSVSLVTNSDVPKKYRKVFDQIIPIPWVTEAATSPLAAEHRWKLYHITPYDETIVLDTDMLLLEDISEWWHYCRNYDVKFCSRIRNHKLDTVVDRTHRKAFEGNKLTNPYYALHYFKKNDKALEFYRVLEFVCNNWEWCWTTFAPDFYQNWLSMDLAVAVAVEITGEYNYTVDSCSPLEFIHMKIPLQDWPASADRWQDTIPWVLNNQGDLIVSNIKQTKLFHYVEKDFVTESILHQLEGLERV
jgi:hypothetical protein